MSAAPVDGTGPPEPHLAAVGAALARRPAAVALALAALAAGVRVIAWQRSAAIMNDGPTFLALAEAYADGRWSEGLAHRFHPLYPLVVAAVRPLAPSGEAAGVAVSIAAGALAVVFLHDFLRRAFGGWVAPVGALLLAVHPYAVPWSADVQSEGLYVALLLGAVALGWRTLEAPSARLGLATGLASGAAYLTRPEGVGVALVVGGLLGLRAVLRRGAFAPSLRAGAGVALGVVLLAAPYVAAMERTSGELRLTRKKSAVDIVTLDDERRQQRRAAPASTPPWSVRATRTVGEVADAARHAFRLDHWIVGALGAASVGGPPGLRAAFLGALVGLYGFVLLGLQWSVGYVSMRHALPPLLPLLGYVALGVPVVGRVVLFLPWRLARGGPVPARPALAVGLALLVTASTIMAVRPQRTERAATRAAAEWLAGREVAGRVAAAKERDAWYARAEYAPLPRPGPGDWVETLRQRGARFAIIDERDAKGYPGLDPSGAGAPDPRVRVLHRAEAHGRTALVVAIRGPSEGGD